MPSAPNPGPPLDAAPGGEDEWWEITLRVPPEDLEPTTALFERVTPAGVVVDWPFRQGEDFGEGTLAEAADPRVCVYVPDAHLEDARSVLRELLQAADRPADVGRVEVRPRRRSEWETSFQRYLKPVRAGRLLVRPRPCAEVPREGEIVVDLEPGLAFGTGGHPTTRMALAGIERLVRPGDRVLDFGTGSGVLACAAGRLGAASVLALDIDDQAVAAARRNAALNGLAAVAVALGEVPPAPRAPYDVVVANISAGVIVSVLPALAAATRPARHCLLGGIIAQQLSRVVEALRTTPLRTLEVDSDGEWRSIVTTRPAHLR